MPSSRYVPGRYPPAGTSTIADKIRERRGARGLTPLDGTLLHVPPVAEGWNSLLGAVRTKGQLPGDIRELMILRVAARNYAAFEWIHHEHVGRDHGLTTPQLSIIRDTTSLPASGSVLSTLQSSALAFADSSTKDIKVSPEVTLALKKELSSLASGEESKTEDLLVEAAAVVATYNMVSRFLVSLDVAGFSEDPVPWPTDHEEHKVPLFDHPDCFSYVETYVSDPANPWLVFCNSLLTNTSLWYPSLPYISSKYNVLLHDQRGHGKSSTPPAPNTMSIQAKDIAHILDTLKITNVLSVIGVSQGGAVALSFGTQFGDKTKSVVSCDTGPKTPAGNKQAWADRIVLAKEKGMSELSSVTVPRWFPEGSSCNPAKASPAAKTPLVEEMVVTTNVDGFALGASALQEYDLFAEGLLESKTNTLLVAGSLDGDGKVAQGLQALETKWKESGGNVDFALVDGSGHLPMIDGTEKYWSIVGNYLESL